MVSCNTVSPGESSAIKCVFVGNANVGKTRICRQLLGNNNTKPYLLTINIDFTKVDINCSDGTQHTFSIMGYGW